MHKISFSPQIMEGSTGNSKNVPKKSTSLGRIKGFLQYTAANLNPLQPACIKFSNFMSILDTSIVITPTLIISGLHVKIRLETPQAQKSFFPFNSIRARAARSTKEQRLMVNLPSEL